MFICNTGLPLKSLIGLGIAAVAAPASAVTVLVGWTFETSIPTTAGPHTAESGAFAATSFASSNSGGTFSNPSGNGSQESFSSTAWDPGDYYQFTTQTTGYDKIFVSYAQATSNTGPANFQFQYSLDGSTFTNVGTVYIGPTATFVSPAVFNPDCVVSFDLSAITALNNQPSVTFRVAIVDTVSKNGGTIASGGTFRIDDFTVTSIPEPSFALLGSLGLLSALVRRRS